LGKPIPTTSIKAQVGLGKSGVDTFIGCQHAHPEIPLAIAPKGKVPKQAKLLVMLTAWWLKVC